MTEYDVSRHTNTYLTKVEKSSLYYEIHHTFNSLKLNLLALSLARIIYYLQLSIDDEPELD